MTTPDNEKLFKNHNQPALEALMPVNNMRDRTSRGELPSLEVQQLHRPDYQHPSTPNSCRKKRFVQKYQ